jgi:hypothetical protein
VNLRLLGSFLTAALLALTAIARGEPVVQFVFTSDVHFGITRGKFRGGLNVDAKIVNQAMVQTINELPGAVFPDDGGLRAGKPIGPIDFVAITGDIANREELYPVHIQTAAASWAQFAEVYLGGITLTDRSGRPTPLYYVPGNHDVSNAIGAPSVLVPARDATSMAEMYNRMMQPAKLVTKDTYNYAEDRIYYSRDEGGVHCIFLTMWPETLARAWMERDLARVSPSTPVFIFCHDQPDIDTRHLTNPNGRHDINRTDNFENVVSDVCADGPSADSPTTMEQRALVAFLKAHRNIVAYFHGHSNWTQYYVWKGPDGDVTLNVFRADSPMKGKIGAKDETKLAFELAVVDAAARRMTVRECLWDAHARANPPANPVDWGISTTVSLEPRAR